MLPPGAPPPWTLAPRRARRGRCWRAAPALALLAAGACALWRRASLHSGCEGGARKAFLHVGCEGGARKADDVVEARRLPPALARRASVGALTAGLAGLVVEQHAARAGLPMMEDFFVGSGAQVRPSDKELAQMREEYEQAWKTALEAPLPLTAQRALDKLSDVEALLKEADLDGVRSILASPEVISIGIRITPKPKNPVRGAWTTCLDQESCKEPLDDARKSLNMLEEWCFENRVEFYNTADQAQVMKVDGGMSSAITRIKNNLEEPMEQLGQARDAIRQVLAASQKM